MTFKDLFKKGNKDLPKKIKGYLDIAGDVVTSWHLSKDKKLVVGEGSDMLGYVKKDKKYIENKYEIKLEIKEIDSNYFGLTFPATEENYNKILKIGHH